MQPFIIVELDNFEKIIINEAHVVSVRKYDKNYAILSMTNGKEYIVISPNYEEWDNDCHIRK